jgi:hypothetical protein
MTSYSLAAIADRWRQYGRSRAVHPTLWDGSLVLATLGPQTTSERTTCRDYSGRNNHGTLTNGPTWSNQSYRGQSFRCASFAGGVNDSIEFGVLPGFDWTTYTVPFTLSTWAYVRTWRGVGGAETFFFASAGTGDYQSVGFQLYVKKLQLIADTNGANVWDLGIATSGTGIGTTALNLGTWYHFAITRSSAGVYSVWVDGRLDGTQTLASNLVTNNTTFAIGRHYAGNTTYDSDGLLSDFRVYDRELSPAELMIFRHPLAAYAVRLPEYFTFTSTPSAAKYWMWARQQSAQVIGGGLT